MDLGIFVGILVLYFIYPLVIYKKQLDMRWYLVERLGLLFFSPTLGINGVLEQYEKLKTDRGRNKFVTALLGSIFYIFILVGISVRLATYKTNVFDTNDNPYLLGIMIVVIIGSAVLLGKILRNIKD